MTPAPPRQGLPLRFGYGTNGFSNHSLDDTLTVLTDLGYDGVALTLDHAHLNPFDAGLARRVSALRARLDDAGLAVVVETGARYLLDPWHKHEPTLLTGDDDGRKRRLDFLERAATVAADLGAEAVSFWSGILPDDVPEEHGWRLLADGCARLVDTAERLGVQLGFEPEPGMLVGTLNDFERLHATLGRPGALGLTLDIGHCQCLEPNPVVECVLRGGPLLANVQIEDMRRGLHEHLMFGEGEIDFPPVLAALAECGYSGLISVELPRSGHAAPQLARQSLAFLREASTLATDYVGSLR
ncbi:sugar phosphate isomerase/epimerase [Streptomyces sp. CC228A]|uniref:sugar phosphate isomerase/epimerase family protein n=1 Tax=Streptomyces sp. CC228A TaxID=2898186 RepID=UPI001F291432|nr:sugar phosphate isomerase/epimerase family protein [Streptomyces sp. CC228A]